MLLRTIHGDDCERFVMERFGIAAPAGAGTVCDQFQPFHEVGGDFLDFFTLTDGVIGIYLGDVTGKGLPAALYGCAGCGNFARRS
jgi:hypothetical protein